MEVEERGTYVRHFMMHNFLIRTTLHIVSFRKLRANLRICLFVFAEMEFALMASFHMEEDKTECK